MVVAAAVVSSQRLVPSKNSSAYLSPRRSSDPLSAQGQPAGIMVFGEKGDGEGDMVCRHRHSPRSSLVLSSISLVTSIFPSDESSLDTRMDF
jgi:hypothetical protein